MELAPKQVQDICEAIEKIYVSAPKREGKNKTLVVNTGFFTVEEKDNNNGKRLQKTMAVITSNGIYSAHQARVQMGKIEKAIRDIAPEISVLVIDPSEAPQVQYSGTLEHCETVYADLMSDIASPLSQGSPKDKLFSGASEEDEEALSQIDLELEQISKLSRKYRIGDVASSGEDGTSLRQISIQALNEQLGAVNTTGENRVNRVHKFAKNGRASEDKENMAKQNSDYVESTALHNHGNSLVILFLYDKQITFISKGA